MVGSILSRPEVQEESRSFRRLSRGEVAPLQRSRPPAAASPKGLHGPDSPTGALDARAGGGEGAAVREQGRCLAPTSELFSPAAAALSPKASSRSPGNRFEARRLSAPSPGARPQAASAPVQARPPPAGARSHFLFGPNFNDGQPPGPARARHNFSCASSRRDAAGDCGRGTGGSAQFPGPSPGGTPCQPRGWRNPGGGRGRVTSLAPPLPINAPAPPTRSP